MSNFALKLVSHAGHYIGVSQRPLSPHTTEGLITDSSVLHSFVQISKDLQGLETARHAGSLREHHIGDPREKWPNYKMLLNTLKTHRFGRRSGTPDPSKVPASQASNIFKIWNN